MIPKIIHYCWFGRGAMSELVLRCIASWREHMPDWQYVLWNEDNFDVNSVPYVQEAYAHRKFAFVSDYVRLWALERMGGVYLDTDVEALRSFEPLLGKSTAFVGLEESSALLPGTCVMGCEAHCLWVRDMKALYDGAHFVAHDGSLDMTTNVQRLGRCMAVNGVQPVRKNQHVPKWGLTVYTHDYFSPITSTRVVRKSENTYCIHHFAGSWQDRSLWRRCKQFIARNVLGVRLTDKLVQLKRRLKRL